MQFFTTVVLSLAALASAAPSTLDGRQTVRSTVANVVCTGTGRFSLGDTQIAELSICGGISNPVQVCRGNPASSTGVSGNAKWTLTPLNGSNINLRKASWQPCVKAGRAQCPGQTFTATCNPSFPNESGIKFSLTNIN